MNTILAHACVIDLFAAQSAVLPDRWCHDLVDGSLTCRFGDSPNAFSWPADAVAEMAARVEGAPRTPDAQALLALWSRLERLWEAHGRPAPDRLLVDDSAAELSLVWEREKLVMVIERS